MRHRNVPNTTRLIPEMRQPNSRGFYGFGFETDILGNPQNSLPAFVDTVVTPDPAGATNDAFLSPKMNVSLLETNPTFAVDPTLQISPSMAPASTGPSKNMLLLGAAAVAAWFFWFRKK